VINTLYPVQVDSVFHVASGVGKMKVGYTAPCVAVIQLNSTLVKLVIVCFYNVAQLWV